MASQNTYKKVKDIDDSQINRRPETLDEAHDARFYTENGPQTDITNRLSNLDVEAGSS